MGYNLRSLYEVGKSGWSPNNSNWGRKREFDTWVCVSEPLLNWIVEVMVVILFRFTGGLQTWNVCIQIFQLCVCWMCLHTRLWSILAGSIHTGCVLRPDQIEFFFRRLDEIDFTKLYIRYSFECDSFLSTSITVKEIHDKMWGHITVDFPTKTGLTQF